MRLVAKGLNRAGILPSTACSWPDIAGGEEDLLKTGWRDWYRKVSAKPPYRLRKDVTTCSSPGCRWVRCWRSSSPPTDRMKVDGLGLYGTTLSTTGGRFPGSASCPFLLPPGRGSGFRPSPKRFHECFPYGIKDERIRPRMPAACLAVTALTAGLLGNPWPSLAEFYRLSSSLRRQLRSIHTPCLVMHAVDDDVASLEERAPGRARGAWPGRNGAAGKIAIT